MPRNGALNISSHLPNRPLRARAFCPCLGVRARRRSRDLGFVRLRHERMIVVGAHGLDSPALTLAQVAPRRQPHYHSEQARGSREGTAMVKRIVADQCCGLIVDVQGFFLSQLDVRSRAGIEGNTANFVRLLGYFRIPLVVTLERPVDMKERPAGGDRGELGALKSGLVATFEKDFFDLTKETKIKSPSRAAQEEAGHRRGLRDRRLRAAIVPRPARSRLRGLCGGGTAVLLGPRRRGGKSPDAGRRRRCSCPGRRSISS